MLLPKLLCEIAEIRESSMTPEEKEKAETELRAQFRINEQKAWEEQTDNVKTELRTLFSMLKLS